jgi:phosphohistidine phosphatase
MKYLTILRHAKSSWAEPGQPDFLRPLNDQGKTAIQLTGRFLRDKKIIPDLVMSSPATIAYATALGICVWVGYDIQQIWLEQLIYEENETAVFGLIRKAGGYPDVFLFGHEPTLSNLIQQLTGERIPKFPTCSAYRIAFDVANWKELTPRSGKCEFFVNPKLLGEK